MDGGQNQLKPSGKRVHALIAKSLCTGCRDLNNLERSDGKLVEYFGEVLERSAAGSLASSAHLQRTEPASLRDKATTGRALWPDVWDRARHAGFPQ